jgi:hypothetical protein
MVICTVEVPKDCGRLWPRLAMCPVFPRMGGRACSSAWLAKLSNNASQVGNEVSRIVTPTSCKWWPSTLASRGDGTVERRESAATLAKAIVCDELTRTTGTGSRASDWRQSESQLEDAEELGLGLGRCEMGAWSSATRVRFILAECDEGKIRVPRVGRADSFSSIIRSLLPGPGAQDDV